ncbi:geranylgeranyl transferase type-1 subunit beta-like protein [Zychaea mexicana]|uniref:geranylgeranyl transferase type-1 subunit beta-like protein n=1 Tax=Zychaea mexicana TaxID=64656 RepID=UPI0022FEC897|nr:geranylgeranyl transferase type-1 subunit beta-like protein [Zychaea mexicana]KAI9489679.1 geranylgeranyl transferase type-1 subunit beta-like protein [Zychaea mexicana]
MSDFDREKHIRYFVANLRMLPSAYTETETNRMTLAFFCLASLELLGALDTAISAQDKLDWIEWIYAQQIRLDTKGLNREHCGFRGSPCTGRAFEPQATETEYIPYDTSHIASTYTALLNLLILGDDLSRVDRDGIVGTIKRLQQEDGSVAPTNNSLEKDARFLYCACAVSYILDDWRGIDVDLSVEYAKRLQTYEHTFSQSPNTEAHGGSTFCGVGALTLMGKQTEGLINKEKLIKWCLNQQTTGFAGRPNKDADACYCFWIGAALEMVGAYQLVNHKNCRDFLLACQTKVGGFGKTPGTYPDLMHSYMSLAALSLMDYAGIGKLKVAVNAPKRSFEKRNMVAAARKEQHI